MAVNPREPEHYEQDAPVRSDRMRAVRSEADPPVKNRRTLGIVVGILILIAVGVVAYMLLYGGGSSGGSGPGGGTGGGGYFLFALSADQLRKMNQRMHRH
jgi:hypothetical protein